MKYNHTNRISLSCYEYAFRTWPLYEWSVKVSTTHSTVEISREPPPPLPSPTNIQLLPKNFLDSDFCHNYLHTPVILNLLPYS